MTRVLLQPAGNSDGLRHYEETVAQPVGLDRLKNFVGEKDWTTLREVYGSEGVPVWGVARRKSSDVSKAWAQVSEGDIALFAGNNQVFSAATVTHKVHSADLAKNLWGTNSDGETWEYIYFLAEVRPLDIPYQVLAKAIGYPGWQHYSVRQFTLLGAEESCNVLDAFGLDSRVFRTPVSDEEFRDLVEKLMLDPEEPLDEDARTRRRKEQDKLREALFGNRRVDKCGICGRELPVEMLVAAHVKKRAKCSFDERCDLAVVMPMCRLGCDELYERGFIGVLDGSVQVSKHLVETEGLQDLLGLVRNRTIDRWSDRTSAYFQWHAENTFRR